MTELFFGKLAMTGWVILSVMMLFFASYIWLIVREVGGIRGTAMATLFTSLSVLFACFALLLSADSLIPHWLVGIIATTVCWPMPVCAFVLTDLYAADRNNHRSFTARSFMWYKRVTKDVGEESRPRHPFTIHPHT